MSKILSSIIPGLGERPVIFDGGFGTRLQRLGLPSGVPPAMWNIQNPSAVCGVHLAYLDAGADMVTTNTFTSNRWFLGDKAEEATAAGVRVARGLGRGVVALDIGPSGRMLEPFGDLPFEDAVEGFARTIAAGAAEQPDCILLETFTDAYEAKAALIAAQSRSDLPVMVSFSFGENGRLLTGLDARGVAAMFEGLGAAAIGANCGMGPDGMSSIISALARSTRLPVFANPNAGLPDMESGQAVYRLTAEDYAPLACALFNEGAWMVGGCCGTEPDHIRALRASSRGLSMRARPANVPEAITSASRTYDASEIVNISDALDARANPRFREILSGISGADDQADAAMELAFDAIDEGADALRVNLDGLADARVYRALIPRLQQESRAPLIFTDIDESAQKIARRVYNGHTITSEAWKEGGLG
ncbi:MAG: homocysteine S-methyltransferase family protein [Oscillospiraceae bacterium]|jgi:5-methyltetrahydrofolate--homocysteine methyltransferase|nr:homocysteine S-methyltransferase family protein [Oscillospiraceae bacterium]